MVVLLAFLGSVYFVLWASGSFSKTYRADPLPRYRKNDPSRSVYFGNGCFWHTQYDMVVTEQKVGGAFGPIGRQDSNVTALVGYAGGLYQSQSGAVCYHGLPSMDYSKMGHAEAVSVELISSDPTKSRAQVAALARAYFHHGFQMRYDGRMQRLDPQDEGPEYRNVIGLPGGKSNADWWPVIEAVNAAHGKMPLLNGSASDLQDDFVVYVYDSLRFPFFRGEAYHQFHPNDVVGRPVPDSYLHDLKKTQAALGRLESTGCIQVFLMFSQTLLGCAVGCASALLALCCRLLYPFCPEWMRCRKLSAPHINDARKLADNNLLPSPPPSAPGSDRSNRLSPSGTPLPYVV